MSICVCLSVCLSAALQDLSVLCLPTLCAFRCFCVAFKNRKMLEVHQHALVVFARHTLYHIAKISLLLLACFVYFVALSLICRCFMDELGTCLGRHPLCSHHVVCQTALPAARRRFGRGVVEVLVSILQVPPQRLGCILPLSPSCSSSFNRYPSLVGAGMFFWHSLSGGPVHRTRHCVSGIWHSTLYACSMSTSGTVFMCAVHQHEYWTCSLT